MDLPYTINFRLTSLFLAVFTWEICSFIFVPFNRSFNRYPPKEKFDNDKIFLTSTLAMKHLTGLCKLFRFFLLRRPWQAISLLQLIWQGKSSSVNTGKAKKRTVVSQKSNWNYSSNERNLKISLNKKTKNSTIISLALKACRQMQGSISWEVLIQNICTFIKLNQMWQLNFCFL